MDTKTGGLTFDPARATRTTGKPTQRRKHHNGRGRQRNDACGVRVFGGKCPARKGFQVVGQIRVPANAAGKIETVGIVFGSDIVFLNSRFD